jgi:OOP family OmpA-OmpF porin
MKSAFPNYLLLALTCALFTLQACKTKKIVQKPALPVQKAQPAPVPTPQPEAPAQAPQEAAPAPAKPDYNFSTIQFEFNSAVLKTSSYAVLDHVAAEMKKDNSVKFVLNGHSSTEGTAEHNMALSVERANAVKQYLTNTGVDGSRLTVKGFGETQPLASNNTEEGKAQNRRVEVKAVQ